MANRIAVKNPIEIDEREILLKILREVKGLQQTFERNDETNKRNIKTLTEEVQALRNELRLLPNVRSEVETFGSQDMSCDSDSDTKEYNEKLDDDDDDEMPVSMKILAEVRSLKEKVEKSDQYNDKIFKNLTRQVRILRAELKQIKNSDSESEASFLPDMPFDSMTDLKEFDNKLLEDDDMVSQLKRIIQRIDAKDYASFLRAAVRMMITDELAINLTWRGTVDKPSIQTFTITTIIRDFCKKKFSNATESEINKVLQQHFLHAKDRVTKRQRTST